MKFINIFFSVSVISIFLTYLSTYYEIISPNEDSFFYLFVYLLIYFGMHPKMWTLS